MSRRQPTSRVAVPRRGGRQDWRTPPAFLEAVMRRLGITAFALDLAASAINAVARRFYTVSDNALERPWRVRSGWAWCNPPFADLAPWMRHAAREGRRSRLAFLVPAAVGAAWWAESVHGRARVIFVTRITFLGARWAYPKDCALVLYGPGIRPGYETWDWRRDVRGSHVRAA